MIEVNMTVNELTEDANMEVDTAVNVKGKLKNPIITVEVRNAYDSFPIKLVSVSGMYYGDGNLYGKTIWIASKRSGDFITPMMYNYITNNYQLYLENIMDTEDAEVIERDNCEIIDDNVFHLGVIDSTKDAHATVVVYTSPLPPE